VPGQEPQVHRARTQAAGACAGHVCAQLRVLAGGTPRAPPAPAERAALFLRRGRPRGLPAPGSGVSVGRDWQRAAAARLPPRRAESDRLPLPARVGGGGAGGGGARPSIFCYYSVMGLLGRPPICHRPRSLITGICHHFPLPMSSALLTAGGGHTHMGLLDTRSCIYTLTHETCGGAMNPVCVWGGGHMHLSVCMWTRTPERWLCNSLCRKGLVKQMFPAADLFSQPWGWGHAGGFCQLPLWTCLTPPRALLTCRWPPAVTKMSQSGPLGFLDPRTWGEATGQDSLVVVGRTMGSFLHTSQNQPKSHLSTPGPAQAFSLD
jgi:hypothetical protein